ncbi:hypothetical protein ABZX94_27225, partial [Streptomyces seoulensis]
QQRADRLLLRPGEPRRPRPQPARPRQAPALLDDGKFVLATFATDRGQREWINDAKDYGGHYLVGRKWVAVGDDGVVNALRGTLGGEVEAGADHSGHGASHSG